MYLTHLFTREGVVLRTRYFMRIVYTITISTISILLSYKCIYIHCCTTIYIIYTTLPWCIYTVGLYPLLYLVYVYTSTVSCYRVLPMYSICTVCICYYPVIYYSTTILYVLLVVIMYYNTYTCI